MALGFAGMAFAHGVTIEGSGFIERDRFLRLNELEGACVRRFLVEVEGLVADGIAFAALQGMSVVVEDFLERALVNDGLVVFSICGSR